MTSKQTLPRNKELEIQSSAIKKIIQPIMIYQIRAELYNYISPSGPLTLQEIAVASSGDNSHLWINDISTLAIIITVYLT